MKIPFVLVAISLVASSGSASAQSLALPDSLPPGVSPALIERGRQVFEDEGLCINCHGPLAGGLIGPNLTDPEWWYAEGSYLAIVRQILVGVPQEQSRSGIVMPPRGGSRISDIDVQNVAAYVWSISHPDAGDTLTVGVTPDMIVRGREVFLGPGGCHLCHGEDATGNLGPNLTDQTWLHVKGSYLAILQQVLVGVPAEQSRTGIEMPPRGGSNILDEDVFAVAAYVWYLGQRGR